MKTNLLNAETHTRKLNRGVHHHHDRTCDHHHDTDHHHGHGCQHHDNHSFKSIVGLLFGAGLLVFNLFVPNPTVIYKFLINGFSAFVTIYLGNQLYQSAWHALKHKTINTATLYSISTLTILGLTILNLFFPAIPLMLESAPLILGFWHLGEMIEHNLHQKINQKIKITDNAPQHVTHQKSQKKISVHDIKVNDVIEVDPQAVFPIDGIIQTSAFIYKTCINGSGEAYWVKAGSPVVAGMRVASSNNPVRLRATKTFEESRGNVIADYQNVFEAAWLEGLRKKYPVEVNSEVLEAIKQSINN